MRFLPIVDRELRIATRSRWIYWCRYLAAIIAVLACATIMSGVNSGRQSAIAGKSLFDIVSGGAMIFALFAGLVTTADSLSREKRDGTLGLLFLTDLKGYDVVFGKLATNSLSACYGLIGAFPVLAIAIALGGLTGGDFTRTVLALLLSLFLSLSIGIAISAAVKSTKSVFRSTILMLLFLVAVLPVLHRASIWNLDALSVNLLNPFYLRQVALEDAFAPGIEFFWVSAVCIFAVSLTLLGIASSVVKTSWQERPVGAFTRFWSHQWLLWSQGREEYRAATRRKLLNQHPMLWIGSRNRLQNLQVWIVLSVMILFWWAAYIFVPNQTRALIEFALGASVTFHLFLTVSIASDAARHLADDLKDGTMELLLSTRLSFEELIEWRILALRHQYLRPCLVVVAVDVLLMTESLAAFHTASGNTLDTNGSIILGSGLGTFLLIASFIAEALMSAWIGLYEGLRESDSRKAALSTVWYVTLMPWLIFGLVWFVAWRGPTAIHFFLFLLVKIPYTLFWVNRVSQRLHLEFVKIRAPDDEVKAQALLEERQFLKKGRLGQWAFYQPPPPPAETRVLTLPSGSTPPRPKGAFMTTTVSAARIQSASRTLRTSR